MSPSFSILVPAYKKDFLEECLRSILSQDYECFEIIVVNDNSPYDLDSIIQEFDTPRLIYKKNIDGFGGKNVVSNWNECLKYATGDFTICMGDDDRLLPFCLSDYSRLIEKHPSFNVFHTNTQVIDTSSTVIDIQESRPETESVYSMLWHRWFGGRSKQYIGDFAFRTTTLRQQGGFYVLPYGWHSDLLSVCLASQDKGIVNSNHYGFQYRINTQTISYNTSNYKEKVEATLLANREFESFIRNACPDSETDRIFLCLIDHKFKEHAFESIRMIVKDDLCYNRFIHNLMYWLRHRNVISLSTKQVLSTALLALYKKHSS